MESAGKERDKGEEVLRMESAGKERDKEEKKRDWKERRWRACESRHLLIYVIDAFDAGGDGGEDFVGDGADGVGEDGGGEVGAEDDGLVALAAVDVGDVDHADVHADIADVGGRTAVDEAITIAVAQSAVESVGIADGDGGNTRRPLQSGATAVADGVALWYVAHLQNGGLEGGDSVDDGVRARIDAVESKSQAHHVEVVLGEVFNAGGVADVAQDSV